MTKLDKETEERFEKMWDKLFLDHAEMEKPMFKQFIADELYKVSREVELRVSKNWKKACDEELARQRKEIVGELEEMQDEFDNRHSLDLYNQAIQTIKNE